MKSEIYLVRGVYLKNMFPNIKFYRILQNFTEFYRILQNFTKFYKICIYLFYKYLQIFTNNLQINILLKQIKYIENYNK